MQTFKNAKETLDALQEQLARGQKEAAFWKSPYVPTTLIIALYRLAESQLDFSLEAGNGIYVYGSYEEFDRQQERLKEYDLLRQWIERQE